MLPSFLDMVIWGHEHECRIDPEESVESGFFVCQPGSSVATSLSPGEAVTKQIGIIEVHTDKYRIVAVPLRACRPFYMTDVVLSNELDALNDKDRMSDAVEAVLRNKVNELVTKANENFVPSDLDHLKMPLPLIRIRVDYTGNFPKINIQRFGQQFVGTVANCEDILLFFRQKKQATKKDKNDAQPEESDLLAVGDVDATPPIHDLVSTLIKDAKHSLHILSENRLAEAVQAFVDKKDTASIADFLTESIKEMQLELQTEKAENKSDIEALIQKKYKRKEAQERAEKKTEKSATSSSTASSSVPSAIAAQSAPIESKDDGMDFDAEEERLEHETDAFMADPRHTRIVDDDVPKDKDDDDYIPSDDEKADEFDEEQEPKSKRKTQTKVKAAAKPAASRGRGRGRGRGAKSTKKTDEEPKRPARGRGKRVVDVESVESDDDKSGTKRKTEWGAAIKKVKGKS